MSLEYPIVAITGSSGSGSSAVLQAFEHIFRRERVRGVYIEGSAFHRYDRTQMREEQAKAQSEGSVLTHFGPEANHLDKLESLFFQYAATGTGVYRHYLHSTEYAEEWGQAPGTFTPWQQMKKNSDLLLYRGLHGAAIQGDIDISQYPDLLIGIVPNINLEWIRKINRDTAMRDYSPEHVRQSILDRMSDYVNYITPQFARTDINFQMVPVVDTSDPFNMRDEPTLDESLLIINFQNMKNVDFVKLLDTLPKSFMSRPNTIVMPGGKLMQALEVVMMPIIHELVEKSREVRDIEQPPEKNKSGLFGIPGRAF